MWAEATCSLPREDQRDRLFYRNLAMSIGLQVVSGCLHRTMGELNSCDRDEMTYKA